MQILIPNERTTLSHTHTHTAAHIYLLDIIVTHNNSTQTHIREHAYNDRAFIHSFIHYVYHYYLHLYVIFRLSIGRSINL